MKKNNRVSVDEMPPIRNFKDALLALKWVYDNEGVPGALYVLDGMLGTGDCKKLEAQVENLKKVLYKIDTCQSNCFDDITAKKICECLCNGEKMVFPLVEPEKLIANT